jgi:hypothetical protein
MCVSFLDKVKSIWQEHEKQYVHGWVQSDAYGPGGDQQSHYVQVRCAAMSLRFAKTNTVSRSPVLQSSVRWPNRGEHITVSSTIDKSLFGGSEGPTFEVLEVADRALTGDLPLNGGDIDVDIALLAAPGSSLFDRVTLFLNDVAEMTMVPQLTAAAPIAEKIAAGVDSLLGNDEVQGILALATSVSTDAPKAGFYVLTDLPVDQERLEGLYIKDSQLLRYDDPTQQWKAAAGFSYLLIEIRPKPSQPNRWKQLPGIADLSQSALQKLTQARTVEDVHEAWPQMHEAIVQAAYSPDLAEVDRKLAAHAMTEQWKEEAQRLSDALQMGAAPEATKAVAPAAAVAEAAQSIGKELEATVQRIVLGQITVQTEGEVDGEVVAGRVAADASVQAGDVSVTAKGNVGQTGSVKGLDIG